MCFIAFMYSVPVSLVDIKILVEEVFGFIYLSNVYENGIAKNRKQIPSKQVYFYFYP